MDPNDLLSKVHCKIGSPMGRRKIVEDQSAKVIVFRVRAYDYDYDKGGAYWGGINDEPLYAAIGEGFEYFVRAKSINEAIADLKEEFPDLKITISSLTEFVDGAIRAALFLSIIDEEDEHAGEPYDRHYEIGDLEDESRKKLEEECRQFIEKNSTFFIEENFSGDDMYESAGHNYILSRNGYIDGFASSKNWNARVAKTLDKSASRQGEFNLYLKDGKVAIG